MKICGIDPGINGALALIDEEGKLLDACLIPTIKINSRKTIDLAKLKELLLGYSPTIAVIEDVHAMPKQGVCSMFRFGEAKGMVIGLVFGLNIPIELVSPIRWQKYFGFSKETDIISKFILRTGWSGDKHISDAYFIGLWYASARHIKR
jgi:crossover junction endodeoxyribonuclease RuvC